MDFVETALARLASGDACGYHHGWEPAAEPVALGALALLAHDRQRAAEPLVAWLADRQTSDGSVGIDAGNELPGWGTGWAVVAWQAAQNSSIADDRFALAIHRALAWIFRTQGSILEHVELLGHDTSIKGWPWVEGTHAWVEPTSMILLALRHTGHDDHPRAREAVLLLQNRLLPGGGANYGNTIVFNQELRAHVQPTGLCLLALAGERDATGLTDKAIAYLEREITARTTIESLCYGLLGLAAHDRTVPDASKWLSAAADKTFARDPAGYKLALLALASQRAACPLIPNREAATR